MSSDLVNLTPLLSYRECVELLMLSCARRMRKVFARLSVFQRLLFLTMLLASTAFSFRLLGKAGSLVGKGGRAVGGTDKVRSASTTALPATAKVLAQQAIDKNKVMVFSKTYCPFCTRAKDALTKLNVQFETIELDVVKEGDQIQTALQELTGQRTVPNVFVNGQHVGGCDATLAKIADGSLQKMLA